MNNKITKKVGDTPLIEWNNIYLKMEMYNPSGSIKDRPAYLMLNKLIKNNIISHGDTIICPSSGNMGIAIAYFSQLFHLHIIIVIPDNLGEERTNLLKAMNAEVIYSSGSLGMKGSIELAKKISQKYNYYYFDQFSSDDNYLSHYQTMDEIIKDLPDVDIIVVGIGTGGTYIGINKYIKEHDLKVKVIGFEPMNVPLINNLKNNDILEINNNKIGIPGIGSTEVSKIIMDNLDLVENLKLVEPIKVRMFWQDLIKQGMNLGISGAASIYVAKQLYNQSSSKKIVAVIPDGLDRYLSDVNV